MRSGSALCSVFSRTFLTCITMRRCVTQLTAVTCKSAVFNKSYSDQDESLINQLSAIGRCRIADERPRCCFIQSPLFRPIYHLTATGMPSLTNNDHDGQLDTFDC